jgi:quercetin dioxygenase-like cupin family protein
MAEYAAKVAPHVYKVLFENEQVRLLEVKMQPGDHTEMHSHPGNCVYALSGGKVTFTAPSGEVAELELTTGASMWMDATDHETDNVGDTAIHALMFEPK